MNLTPPPESAFDTFPWPQSELGSSRRESALTSSLKDRSGNTSAATATKIDAVAAAVLAAYGFSAKKDLPAQLRALNLEAAAKIQKGEPATTPGIPPGCAEPASPGEG